MHFLSQLKTNLGVSPTAYKFATQQHVLQVLENQSQLTFSGLICYPSLSHSHAILLWSLGLDTQPLQSSPALHPQCREV